MVKNAKDVLHRIMGDKHSKNEKWTYHTGELCDKCEKGHMRLHRVKNNQYRQFREEILKCDKCGHTAE